MAPTTLPPLLLPDTTPKRTALAVLPLVNMSSSGENEFFCDGMTEEIIHALAKIPQLKVTSRTSSFFFKHHPLPLPEIAQKLGVSVLLEGSVRLAGKRLRITVQLIDVANDEHFWTESWDRELVDAFAIQDEISLKVADKLREQLGHLEIEDQLVARQTESLDAYEAYLKGRWHFNHWNPGEVQLAISSFEQALARDPQHLESILGLADAYGFLATAGFAPYAETWQTAVTYIHQAAALNPAHAGVNYQLANLAFFTDCDFAGATRYTLKALEPTPAYPEAMQFMAFLYLLRGDMSQAGEQLQAALALDPLNQETLFYHALFRYRNREYPQARPLLEELVATNEKNVPALVVLAYLLIQTEAWEPLAQLLNKLDEGLVMPDERLGLHCLAQIRQKADQAPRLLAELEGLAQADSSFHAHAYLFLAYANLGRYDDAFALLEASWPKKSSILLLAFSDPLINDLAQDPRYRQWHPIIYPPAPALAPAPRRKLPYLEPAQALADFERLLAFMAGEQPFLNPNLSLRLLAEQIDLHPNQLSWLLNEQAGQHFNEFINTYRVQHFKQLVQDPALEHITLMGLAFESGFNSKTVFNTAFKKITGMTPSAFKKRGMG